MMIEGVKVCFDNNWAKKGVGGEATDLLQRMRGWRGYL